MRSAPFWGIPMCDALRARVAALYADLRSWRGVGRAIANGSDDAETFAVLANAVHRGAIKDSPTLRRALGIRKTEAYTLAFRFRSRADFEAARAAVDAHPGGRSQWLMEQVQEVSDDEH